MPLAHVSAVESTNTYLGFPNFAKSETTTLCGWQIEVGGVSHCACSLDWENKNTNQQHEKNMVSS